MRKLLIGILFSTFLFGQGLEGAFSNFFKYSTVYAGFNITCIGDNRSYSYLPTRNGSTISDEIAKHVLKHKDKKFKKDMDNKWKL